MSQAIDLTGNVFGRLTVVERMPTVHTVKGQRTRWLCKCSCGKAKIVDAYALRSGHTQSCGCLHSEVAATITGTRSKTHGETNTRLFRLWVSIKGRCYNRNSPSYNHYGGRGVGMCDEWKNSFLKFKEWAVYSGYDEKAPFGICTIERIDVNGNYCPENCKWATMKEQDNNKRNSLFLTFNGKTQTAAMWADEIGINRGTFYSRLKSGWSVEDAIMRPVV